MRECAAGAEKKRLAQIEEKLNIERLNILMQLDKVRRLEEFYKVTQNRVADIFFFFAELQPRAAD